ncbi:hypothetical protein NEF87_000401 [Candidatus Lokiarchaeum ossiferum]|uniref:Uncharacterized protein n=1 Tax=Candidatus Lokiarchaeum ossiferum TaxID=2951803 RepID=A0ABY6HNI2_9ARCH|nr:hypothetical protein NEF87_000401 [Candidatus Lokiarchaeum sp. B-35]
MDDKFSVLTEQIIETMFFCNKCQENHWVQLPKSLFNTKSFPVSYAFVHGNPQIIAILYIDKNHTVRGVEYPKQIGINRDQLSEIIDKSKSQTFSSIPEDLIYAFEVIAEDKIKKIYSKQGFEQIVNFSAIREMITLTPNFVKTKESFREFFIKYSDCWIGGMELYDHYFTMVVDASIDIDHFKFQMMAMFESLI